MALWAATWHCGPLAFSLRSLRFLLLISRLWHRSPTRQPALATTAAEMKKRNRSPRFSDFGIRASFVIRHSLAAPKSDVGGSFVMAASVFFLLSSTRPTLA